LTGPNPTDRGKSGSKIHLITDRNGLPLPLGISGRPRQEHPCPCRVRTGPVRAARTARTARHRARDTGSRRRLSLSGLRTTQIRLTRPPRTPMPTAAGSPSNPIRPAGAPLSHTTAVSSTPATRRARASNGATPAAP